MRRPATPCSSPPPPLDGSRCNLIGLDRQALEAEDGGHRRAGLPRRQLWHWIYHRGATDFAAMTSWPGFPRPPRRAIRDRAPAIATAQHSVDGTRKWLLRFGDGQEVETVHIPEEDRARSASLPRSAAR